MVYGWAGVAVLVIGVAAWLRWQARSSARDQAERAAGRFAQRFVVVEDDGQVREPNFLEAIELNREHDPQDSGRPRFKRRHDSRNPAGTLWGYLDRRRLPAGTAVAPRESDAAARERAFRTAVEAYRRMGAVLIDTPEGDVLVASHPSGCFTLAHGPDGQPRTERLRCPANWRSPGAP